MLVSLNSGPHHDNERISAMNAAAHNRNGLPQVSTRRSLDEFRTLATQSLECREKVIYYVGSVENLAAIFDEQYDREFYIPTRLQRGIGLKILIPESPALQEYRQRDKLENRETRFLRPDMHMDSSFMIHDDTVVFFGQTDEQYAIEMQAPSLASAMKTLFLDVWNHTP
jgi:sugar-specific transcriptional regulator TrmB